uniref:HOOK_N domain-containing protein n=1 Tax=Caenorhabditis tropicalis TaxID=1561998 RepID=A0A1I7UMC8_9PELO
MILKHSELFLKNSQEELKKLLLLLLGCAIQSDKKKVFVERITRFDEQIQEGLAHYIQQLTEGTQIVRSIEDFMKDREDSGGGGGVSGSVEDMDSDDLESTTTTSSNGESCGGKATKDQSFLMSRSTSPTSEARHLTVQVAHLQHEMRQLRTQAENKDEECRKLEVELEEKNRKITCLENDRLRNLDEKRKNKELTDDLQAARCRIEKLQPLEHVEKKYREARDEKEMFKSKYEAVTKKHHTLEEEFTELEKNFKSLQLESKTWNGMDDQLTRLKNNLRDLESEITKKNSDIEDLMVEKHRMSLELKEREERIQQLEMPTTTNNTPRFMDSLADQLEDAKQDEFEMMKAEIRKLRAQTEGATPDTTIISYQVDLDDLRKQISSEQHKNAELQLEIQKLQVERKQIDGNMERIGIELEETSVQVENLSLERDEAVKQLHEARRKFGQFQTEFGVKTDESLRRLHVEIDGMREREEEMEMAMGKIREENRRLQFELDEVREEKTTVEDTIQNLERSKRALDLEKGSLKSRILELEDNLEAQKMALLNSEVSQKRLEDRDTLINTLHNQKNDLENDLKTCQTHLDLESKKLQRLREDLVQEKSKRADLVGRLRSLCTTLSLNGAHFDVEGMDDEQLINSIDDIMMNALVAVKRERDDLRIQGNQQIAELSDLKRDIEKLRRSESASLNESDDRVRELTRENMHAKEQVFMLQEKLRELNLELSTKNKEIEIAKASIEDLNRNSTASGSSNAEIARLQVSLRNSQIQEDLVKQENQKMGVEIQDVQKQLKKKGQDLDELESMHKTLLMDHSRLQQLHNLLTRDYDEAKKESMDLRQKVQNIPRQQAVFMNANIRELEAKLFGEGAQDV